MTSIILIESSGTVKSLKAKDLTVETLYRKAGYRNADQFEKRHVWVCKLDHDQEVSVALFAKTTGKALHENKYNFPPPIESDLYFGTVILVQVASDGQLINLEIPTWNAVYDKLFAGFENLGEDDSEEEELDELEEDEDDEEDTRKKNQTYVSSDETEEELEDEDMDITDDNEDEGPARKKSKSRRKPNTTGVKSKNRSKKSVEKKAPAVVEPVVLVVSELEEELYCYSDEN